MAAITRWCETCDDQFLTRPLDIKRGNGRFCSMGCHAASRRTSAAEKKEKKRLYDIEYRAKHHEKLNADKRKYYFDNHEHFLELNREYRSRPENRERHKAYIKEYQASPEWKEHKREYDLRYRAVKLYGDEELADVYIVLVNLENEIAKRMDKYDIYLAKGTINKRQERQKEWQRKMTLAL